MSEQLKDSDLHLFEEHVFTSAFLLYEPEVVQLLQMVDCDAWTGKNQGTLNLANSHRVRGLLDNVPVHLQRFTLQDRLKNVWVNIPRRLRQNNRRYSYGANCLKG